MKNSLRVQILAVFLVIAILSPAAKVRAQGILGIGSLGIIGLPDTTHYGDTIEGMGVWLQNQGLIPYTASFVTFLADPNNLGLATTIGTLNLPGLLMLPGDSVFVPLDAYVVSPQNSNSGSNIMVIWPTSIGTQPGDSAHGDYFVDSPTIVDDPRPVASSMQVYVSPDHGSLQVVFSDDQRAEGELRVVDLQGRQLHSQTVTQKIVVVDVQQWPAGMYILQWMGNMGQPASVKFLWPK